MRYIDIFHVRGGGPGVWRMDGQDGSLEGLTRAALDEFVQFADDKPIPVEHPRFLGVTVRVRPSRFLASYNHIHCFADIPPAQRDREDFGRDTLAELGIDATVDYAMTFKPKAFFGTLAGHARNHFIDQVQEIGRLSEYQVLNR